jgi:hypothetical protein
MQVSGFELRKEFRGMPHVWGNWRNLALTSTSEGFDRREQQKKEPAEVHPPARYKQLVRP